MAVVVKHSRRQPLLLGPPSGSPIQFTPVLGAEVERSDTGAEETKKVRYMTATMMDVYCGKSLEEIRFQDYWSGRNMAKIHVPSLEHPRFKIMTEYGTTSVQNQIAVRSDVKMADVEKVKSERSSLCSLFSSMNKNSGLEKCSAKLGDFGSSRNLPEHHGGTILGLSGLSVQARAGFPAQLHGCCSGSFPLSTTSLFPFNSTIFPISPCSNSCQLYPIFVRGELVAYTTEKLETNPCCTATFPSSPEKQDASVETDLRPECEQLCANLEACSSCLYRTLKSGEFVVDESPEQKRIGSMILQSYETIWNNAEASSNDNKEVDSIEIPSNDSSTYNTLSNYENSTKSFLKTAARSFRHSKIPNEYDIKILNYENNIHLHCPFIESKLALRKRRLLLQTERIFPAEQKRRYSLANERFTLFPEDEERTFVSGSPKGTGDFRVNSSNRRHRRRLGRTVNTVTDCKVRSCRKMEAELHPKEQRPNEDDGGNEKKDSTEHLSLALRRHCYHVGTDRSRRPRSKSLSVRPKGRSCGVRLTRERYYCIPSVQVLDTMVDEDGRCLVENFQIGHFDYGYMIFEGEMDVAGVNIDEIVVFNLKEVYLYPSGDQDCDQKRRQINKPALVTLLQVWPQRVGRSEFIRDVNAINAINYEDLLRKTCEQMEVEFVAYDPYIGHWQFRLPNRLNEDGNCEKQ